MDNMYKIQANASGTRSIELSETHLETIHRYQLLDHLVGSNGIIDEGVLDKLKLTVRSLLGGESGQDHDLLDLCLDVIYHSNMKAFGLSRLVELYSEWQSQRATAESSDTEENKATD